MANDSSVTRLAQLREKFASYDFTKVTRENLGQVSLTELKPIFDELSRKLSIASIAPALLPQNTIETLITRLEYILQIMDNATSMTPENYVANRQNTKQQIESYIDLIRSEFPPVITVAIESAGLLDGAEGALKQIADEGTRIATSIKERGAEILKAAEDQAGKIVGSARSTAQGVSIIDAQTQFNEAQKDSRNKAIGWSLLSALVFVGFLWFANWLLHNPPRDMAEVTPVTQSVESNSPLQTSQTVAHTLYFIAIRITLLTALGALATFCLRIMRAHLHMNEFNLHRRRVANSLSALVQAAETPEQRDAVLIRLVDGVVAFGNSGLIDSADDHITVPTIAIDAFMKGSDAKK